jgi:thioredoxin 1
MISVDEATFSKLVLKSPHYVLVYFWAPWCGLCRFVKPLLHQLKDDWGGDRLQLVEINADKNLKLANTYRLKSLPTLLLFEHGQVVNRLENFRAREDLQKIQQYIRPHNSLGRN